VRSISQWAIVIVVATAAIVLSGCTTATTPNGDERPAAPSQATTTRDADMSASLELDELGPSDEVVLATSTNVYGIGSLSPFTPTTGRIAIYSDCIGAGHITITVDDVAESSRDCREHPDEPSHRDELDIDPNGVFAVTVTADGDQVWSVTVSSVD
jgi:hypothetical protein